MESTQPFPTDLGIVMASVCRTKSCPHPISDMERHKLQELRHSPRDAIFRQQTCCLRQ